MHQTGEDEDNSNSTSRSRRSADCPGNLYCYWSTKCSMQLTITIRFKYFKDNKLLNECFITVRGCEWARFSRTWHRTCRS